MFRHCVMFTWNDTATDEAKAAVASGLDEMAKLDFVGSFVHGPDVGIDERSWDYVVVADFASADDYQTYANDADHQKLIADVIKPAVSGRAAVQYEIP